MGAAPSVEPRAASGPLPWSPAVGAAILAAGYAALCGGYILLSTQLVASQALSVAEMERIEVGKGLGFVAITGLLFFVLARTLFARIARQHDELARAGLYVAEADRRALAGEFASAVAHDLRNVLTVAELEVDELVTQAPPDAKAAAVESVRGLREALGELGQLSARLVELGGGPVRRRPVDLTALAREVVRFAQRHPKLRGREVRLEASAGLRGTVDRLLLQRALLNLLLNAADATDPAGRIQVRVAADASGVRLEVHDDGPGVPADAREEIFRAFRTRRGDGTGLGLFSVAMTAQGHGGRATVEDSPLGGACFRLELPAEGATSPTPSA